MSGRDPDEAAERPSFSRPWERPADEVEAPVDEVEKEVEKSGEEVDLSDWEAMTGTPSGLDDLTHEHYVNATTEEHRDLAAEVTRLRDEEFEHQAVSATIPGVGSGLVSFEDVTGRRGVSEEDVEAAEQARSSDLALRVGSAVVLVGLFILSLLLGGWWFTSFVSLVMVVALGELYATLRRAGYAPLALIGLVGVVLMPVVAHTSGVTAMAGVAAAAIVATALAYSLVGRRRPLENAAVTVWGMAWVGLLAFAVPLMGASNPVAMVLLMVLLTALVDIGSYFIGHGFGRRPMAPLLSPNKTVGGFVGGIVTAMVAAFVLSTLPPYEEVGLGPALVLAVLIGILAPVGDLAESMVKRSLGVKDMGSILPGHGGMLDRIDSFLVTAPAAYLFMVAVGLL